MKGQGAAVYSTQYPLRQKMLDVADWQAAELYD